MRRYHRAVVTWRGTPVALAMSCAFGVLLLSGRSRAPARPLPDTALPVRSVRVLIASDVDRIRIRVDRAISIHDDSGVPLGSHSSDDWITISPGASGGLGFGDTNWPVRDIELCPDPDETVAVSIRRSGKWSDAAEYPGTLRVILRDTGRLNVINLVDVEEYTACVVVNEVWPTFETEAYRAQAIASRTFVLFQMQRRNEADYDVVATQRSQVYRGVRTDRPGRRAREAARYTHGIVLTYRSGGEDRLFCAYYSAACGGISQSAAIFGSVDDIEPLSGGVRCDYCKIAPGETYRWGPVRLTKQEVRSRLVAAYPKTKSLGQIRDITVIERTPSARPVNLRITGTNGEHYDILAERFRLAMGGSEIRSTDFTLGTTGRHIVFNDGRGFGHGLGLCQWGMQGQALQGRRAGEILHYYYPGSKLTRVY